MQTVPRTLNTELESYFEPFRNNILGIDLTFESPYGTKKVVYADWTASGRLYRPIEERMMHSFGPFVANTHTETSIMGTTMTHAYHHARDIIKKHVNASPNDVLVTCGTGMTGAVNKFQRILGLKVPEHFQNSINIPDTERPVVFVSHMEHHSNHTSWLETIAKVVVIPCNEEGLFCLENFKAVLETHKDTPYKIASVTSCSNVTGVTTPYYEVAKLMHRANGLCFVDFACSAPYMDLNMHPDDPEAYLDAIFLSPHKFLGGPGTSGVLVFDKKLYKNAVPDNPGGGTVTWTTPWGTHSYIDNIEEREDGGTPGFLQVIRISLAMKLKEQMSVDKILAREHELLAYLFDSIGNHEEIDILAGAHRDRLGVVSFNIGNLHHDLAVKLLNDRFGIQSRGGCSCAGTYGHYLLGIDEEMSDDIVKKVLAEGSCELKPGWVRVSIHPTTTNAEIEFICDSILAVAEHYKEWQGAYTYRMNKYMHESELMKASSALSNTWFNL